MKPIIIAIAGGTASGKTTVVDEIVSRHPRELGGVEHPAAAASCAMGER